MSSGLRGTDATQDSRFKDKEAASIKATKFPKSFDTKVDLRKVNIAVLRPWIAKKVTEMIKFEDDVVVEYVFGMLEDKDTPMPDPRKMQVNLLGFMDKYGAAHFMESLWALLLSAQDTVGGVPAEFIEAKKKEIQMQQALGRPVAEEDEYNNRGGPPRDRDSRDRDRDRPAPRERQRDEKPYLPPAGSGARERDRPPRGDRGGYGGGRGGRDQGWQPPRLQDRGYGARGPPPPPSRDDRRDRVQEGGPGGWQPRQNRDRDRDRASRSRSPARRPPPREQPRRRSPSPSTRRRESPSRRRREDDTPPRRRKDDDSPPRQRRRDDDSPPPRRRESPPRRGRDDTPPRRRDQREDDTPPRSPPPRRRDASPARRKRDDSTPPPAARRRDDSATPPRQRRRRDSSTPPRPRPHQGGREDDTPPRRMRSPTITPPRQRRRSSTPPPRNGHHDVNEPAPAAAAAAAAEVHKKGRGFEKKKERELEAPLKASKWGAMSDDD